MARKPNYAFERNTRAKAKAEKREAKRQAKLAAKTENPADDTDANAADADGGPVTETPRPD
jgi:hypothetical protein